MSSEKKQPISIYQLAKCEHYSYHTKCIDFRYWNINSINNNVCPVLTVCFPIQQWCLFWWFLLNMQFENHFSLPFLRLFLDVCVHAKSLQSCPTLCNPMDSSPPGSSVHGILQARILEWAASPSSRGSSRPSAETLISLCLLRWQAGSLSLAPPGECSYIHPNTK